MAEPRCPVFMGASPLSRKILIRKSAWQTAEFIGNTFKYMQYTAQEIGEDRMRLAGKIDNTVTVLKTLAAVGVNNSPFSGGGADIVDLTADTVGELLSKWALKSGADFDIVTLATKLAVVSDHLRSKA